jgi:hypothetical protein
LLVRLTVFTGLSTAELWNVRQVVAILTSVLTHLLVTSRFNLNPNWSIDNNACIPFCSAGQVVKVNDTMAFVAAWDHSMGGRNGGLWMVQFQSPLPDPNTSVFPFAGASKLAGNKGLGGNQPTSLAIEPDGAAYFGN